MSLPSPAGVSQEDAMGGKKKKVEVVWPSMTTPSSSLNEESGEGEIFQCLPCVDGQEEVEALKEEEKAPADRIVLPSDVTSFSPEDDSIFIIGTHGLKVTRIAGLGHMQKLTSLVLRSCLIAEMEGVEELLQLERLEIYDNQLVRMSGLEKLSHLTVLDISYNSIREMVSLSSCPLLEELYIAQNKLRKIEGLAGLRHLKTLDLGANRIKKIEGLEDCVALQSLWLGKNKIEVIEGLSDKPLLRQLDVQCNRLTFISGLEGLAALEELYLANNAIVSSEGVPVNGHLSTIDLSGNGVRHLTGIENLTSLEELWMSGSQIAAFDELLPLTALPALSCLYLEHSPLAKDFEYRMRITSMLPSLEQLDATSINRSKC